MSNTTKAIYEFNAIPMKIPIAFSTEMENSQIHMELQGTPNRQIFLKKNKVGGLTTFQFQNLLQSYSSQDSVVLT